MSSIFLPNSKPEYDAIEGGVGAFLFFITPFVLLQIIGVYIYHSDNRVESLHTILSVFYSSFTDQQPSPPLPQQAPPPPPPPPHPLPPVLLIWKREAPAETNRWLTYIYYGFMAIMSCMWFISFAVDNTIFHKTTTCNDLNPNDMRHVCFAVNESYRIVDCTEQQMIPVVCYIFNPNLAGIGIAYSITKLCLALVDVYYLILMKLTVKCQKFIFVLRLIAAIGAPVVFIAWWGGFSTGYSSELLWIRPRTYESYAICLHTFDHLGSNNSTSMAAGCTRHAKFP